MGGNFSRLVSRPTGNTIDGPADDAEWDNIIANMTPTGLDDYSANNTEMRSTADPYPGSVESLATSLKGELERKRYVLKQQHVTSQWYIYPDLVSKTAAYTATQDDRIILCDSSGGAFTVTLPAASGLTDKVFYIKKTDSSVLAVTIDGDGSETIDGATTVTLDSQYSFATIVCDGSNWIIIGGNSTTQKWKKGVDVASATALPVIGDGNYFDVTGTTAVTSIDALGIGTVIKLHFDGILILTHHATDLVLPSGANITTAADDEAEFVQYADGDWRCTNYSRADGTPLTFLDVPLGQAVATDLTLTGSAASPPDTNTLVKDNICKGWIKMDGTGTISIYDSYNVSGIVDNSTGNYTVTWDTDFANTDYCVATSAQGATIAGPNAGGFAVGSLEVHTFNTSGSNVDADLITVVAYGDQ